MKPKQIREKANCCLLWHCHSWNLCRLLGGFGGRSFIFGKLEPLLGFHEVCVGKFGDTVGCCESCGNRQGKEGRLGRLGSQEDRWGDEGSFEGKRRGWW